MTLQTTTWEERRKAAIRAARAAQWEQLPATTIEPAQETRQPTSIITGWPPITPAQAHNDDRPGFGTGMVVAVILIGVFALLWKMLDAMDGQAIAFLLGGLAVLCGMFLCLIIFSWAQSQ